MQRRDINAAGAPTPAGQHTQAVEVTSATRTLYVAEFANATSRSGLGLENLVKITTIVCNPADIAAVRAGRASVLGEHRPASTLVVAGLANAAWKVEVTGSKPVNG